MKRRIRRALKRAGLYNAFHITVIAVLLTGFCVTLFNVKEPEQQEEETETTQAEVMQNPETMTQTAESIEDKYKVFDTMSEDWGSDDLEGFVFYDLPERYADKEYFIIEYSDIDFDDGEAQIECEISIKFDFDNLEETARVDRFKFNNRGYIYVSCVNAEITPIDEDEMALRCLREDKGYSRRG